MPGSLTIIIEKGNIDKTAAEAAVSTIKDKLSSVSNIIINASYREIIP